MSRVSVSVPTGTPEPVTEPDPKPEPVTEPDPKPARSKKEASDG